MSTALSSNTLDMCLLWHDKIIVSIHYFDFSFFQQPEANTSISSKTWEGAESQSEAESEELEKASPSIDGEGTYCTCVHVLTQYTCSCAVVHTVHTLYMYKRE